MADKETKKEKRVAVDIRIRSLPASLAALVINGAEKDVRDQPAQIEYMLKQGQKAKLYA